MCEHVGNVCKRKEMLAGRNVCCDFLLENKQGTRVCMSMLGIFPILPTMPKTPFLKMNIDV